MTLTNVNSTVNINATNHTTTNIMARSPSGFTGILLLRLLPNARNVCKLLMTFLTLSGINVLNNNITSVSLRANLVVFITYLPVTVTNLLSTVRRKGASMTSVNVMTGGPRRFNGTVLFPTVIRACTVLTLLVSVLTIDKVRI